MFWIIEYVDGTSITEKDINFKFVNKKNVKKLYLVDEHHRSIGFDAQSGIFFINDKKFDFKVGNGPFDIIQYKTASVAWSLNGDLESKVVSYNIGYSNRNENLIFKYILSVLEDSIFLIAKKENLSGDLIDEKKIKLM